jgi:alpha,alpha-trehalase
MPFWIRHRRQVLDVDVTQETLTIPSRPFAAHPITIAYRGHYREPSPGERCRFRLLARASGSARSPHFAREAGRRRAKGGQARRTGSARKEEC